MAHYNVSVADYSCEVTGDFKCARCGFADPYSFSVSAQGQATVGATSADSREVAAGRAEKIAAKLSEQTINLMACPRCQAMSPGALGRFVRAQAPVATIMAAIFGGGLALFGLLRDASPIVWGVPTFVATEALFFFLGYRAARGRPVTFGAPASGPG